jgi:7-cyano-7-deazaguanine synthase
MTPPTQRAVVLLSGGMDSCVCAALATRDYATAALHVSYGQRTEHRERQSFLEICDRLQIHDKLIVRNEALRAIGGSALTDENIAVPTVPSAGREIPVTYVPVSERPFLVGRGQLGRGAGSHQNLYRRGRTRQLRLS